MVQKTNQMKKVTSKIFSYISEDKSCVFEVEFIQGFPLNMTHKGKNWAKRTQCIIRYNGFIEKINTITKHVNDKDDLKYAYMNSFNPIKDIIFKKARINITNQILDFCKQNS